MSEPRAVYDASPVIVTGDALALIPTLADGSVSLVVTSPPYPGQYGNTMDVPEWLWWVSGWLGQLKRVLTQTGVIALNIQFKRGEAGWYDSRIFKLALPGWCEYNLLDLYIYGKPNPPPNGPLTFCDPPSWEFVFVLTRAARPQDVIFNPVRKPYSPKSITKSNGRLYSNMSAQQTDPHPDGARQTTLMIMSKSADQGRPSAKGISFPRALPDRFIRQYTNPGDLVLDPFCGVGTTVKVAAGLGRRAVGFEIDPEEAEKAREWLTQPVQQPLFRSAQP